MENTGRLRPLDWVRSVPHAVTLMARRAIQLRHDRLGRLLGMSDGRSYVAFRETVTVTARPGGASPAVLQPRFRLRGMGRAGSRRHRLFWRVCVITTPFFVGLDGFRSKLWMCDPSTGDYAGLYEWDDATTARAYADGLCGVLRLLSVPGSVSYELIPDCDVDAYLAACGTSATGTPGEVA